MVNDNSTSESMKIVYKALGGDPLSLESIARKAKMPQPTTRRALNALAWFQLVEKVFFMKPIDAENRKYPFIGWKKRSSGER